MKQPVCVVFAYGHFGCAGLEALRAAGAYIPLVFSHNDNPQDIAWWPSVQQWCHARGIPVLLDQPLTPQSSGDTRLVDLSPDYLFSFYYKHLLPAQVLDRASRGAFNLHGSLLPRYRGRAPINWQLVHGERRSGVTLHAMLPRADAGPIVAQSAVEVGPDQDAYGLTQQLLEASGTLLGRTLPAIFSGTHQLRDQDLSQGSVFPGRSPKDGEISWQQSAGRVHDLVRAVAPPWPGAFTFHRTERLTINRTRIAKSTGTTGVPGTVLGDGSIACGQGSIVALDLCDSTARPVTLPQGSRLMSHPGDP